MKIERKMKNVLRRKQTPLFLRGRIMSLSAKNGFMIDLKSKNLR